MATQKPIIELISNPWPLLSYDKSGEVNERTLPKEFLRMSEGIHKHTQPLIPGFLKLVMGFCLVLPLSHQKFSFNKY